MSSLKSSEIIQKEEGGPDSTVSNNQISLKTLNELAMNWGEHTIISSFREAVNRNPKGVKIAQIYFWGYFLGPPNGTTPAAVATNENLNLSSFKSSENIQKKECGPDSTVRKVSLYDRSNSYTTTRN